MNICFSEDQDLLRDSVSRFVARNYDFDQRARIIASTTGYSEENWRLFAEMGWLAVSLPEEHGGLGGTMVDIAVIAEELGKGLAMEPFLACGVFAPRLVNAVAKDEQRARLLPAIASGERKLAVAHDEADEPAVITTVARRSGDGYVLNGHKVMAVGAPLADGLLVSAHVQGEDGLSLFLVDPAREGVKIRAYRTIDEVAASDVSLTDVVVSTSDLLGSEGGAGPGIASAVDELMIAACAEAVGMMDRALWITRDYLKTRHQFGVPLGSFQALQHRMAEMFIELEQSRSMVFRGLSALKADPGERRRQVVATKAYVSQAAKFLGGQTIQLHGAIGMTEEYVISHYYKRLVVFAGLNGTSEDLVDEFAAML